MIIPTRNQKNRSKEFYPTRHTHIAILASQQAQTFCTGQAHNPRTPGAALLLCLPPLFSRGLKGIAASVTIIAQPMPGIPAQASPIIASLTHLLHSGN
jgi:hypothetical protein